MKKFIILICCFFTLQIARADEGMWLPVLLQQLNIDDMRANGFKLTAEDIYSVNKSSMKDAVVLFGGGCTAEVISGEGLLLTNHHCGFSSISAASSLDHNYLRDGFWAKDHSEEIPCPGLTVTFIISMVDVTDSILPYLNDAMSEQDRAAAIKILSAQLEKRFKGDSHYDAAVRSFYYGNAFYLFLTETFRDIRLVGAPPASVGNFGGETDNWIWPRHTGDFSMFRIYANKDNLPAEFSADNQPFVPRYYFPISLKGVKENDFTMVYGFPGRTQEYLPAAAVDLTINSINPNRILVRDERIRIINNYMQNNDTVTLMYASKLKGMANAYKKWKGEMIGLQRIDAIAIKKSYERSFQQWTNTTAGKPYAHLLADFDTLYAAYKPYSKINDFTSEAAFGIEIINYAGGYRKLIEMCKNDTVSDETIKKEAEKILTNAAGFFKNYYRPIDLEVFASLLRIYADSVPVDIQPEYFHSLDVKYHHDFSALRDDVFAKTKFSSYADVQQLLNGFTRKKGLALARDPVYKIYESIASNYDAVISGHIAPMNAQINALMRQYMKAQMLFDPEGDFYPDANSTLRVAYGTVQGYEARDAVFYSYATTDQGLEEKYVPGDEEFDLPAGLMQLLKANNFGRYADANGNLPIAFIATNHTTGGNSGSPVINANGELIGTNYDRVWEGTMSDILFDPEHCRNITLDIRYTLFIIDQYAHADNLIKEMKIVE